MAVCVCVCVCVCVQVRGSSPNLTDFLFSKYFLTCHTETRGLPAEKGGLSLYCLSSFLKFLGSDWG